MKVGIIGAGPAGLSAAIRLQELGADVVVFEASPHIGGLARSMDLFGQRVDIGPHRFFSQDPRINSFWHRFAGKDARTVNRITRIFYRKRFFDYPLSIRNVLTNLGPGEIAGAILSYVRQRVAPSPPKDTFESWVVGRFGRKLYEMFFRSYSEKLWGIKCTELDSDFAAQRIKTFSLGQSLIAALGLNRNRHATLVDEFSYPADGSGQVYERMVEELVAKGGEVRLNTPVRRVCLDGRRATGVELADGSVITVDHVVSTMPLTLLVKGLDGVPDNVVQAASQLRFRNTLLVFLEVQSTQLFSDQWVYVHEPDVRTGRVTNFRNWAPEIHRNLPASILASELWCFPEDEIWSAPDADLIALAEEELRRIGLLNDEKVSNGHVVRISRCYPVYATGYRTVLEPVVDYLKTCENLTPIGRYGAFKYNNQDHSILMGLLAAENIMGQAGHDLWAVNTDYGNYQEAGAAPSAAAAA